VWKENAQNFFLQILALEGQNREVRLSVMKLTQERDAALVKVKASEDKHSKAVHEPKEASKE
jgi:hypothetical protein